ncbi:MAG: arylsulfatase [Cytophagales bacterium]|nr:arylsulfatase [Cytophagales bacterium]
MLFFATYGQKNDQPNIIIILSDDQGWGDLGFNGNQAVSTPMLDKMAKNGVSFQHFYVSPVCSPTRAEFLTGRYHVRGGVSSTSTGRVRLDLDETTIAQIFKKAGYSTAAYGKWHNGGQAPYHPNSRGFDDFYGFCSGHWGNYFNPILEHNGEITRGKGFITDDLTNHAIDFIGQHSKSPFFLYLPLNTPHSPMQVPESYWAKYKNIELTQKGSIASKENSLHTKAALALSENIDWNVGRLLSRLDQLKLTKNTIVIYFSDNGPNGHRWNDGMKGIKGTTDEGGVRSPLIMQWPGKLKGGTQIKTIASVMDLLPTLADLANIPLDSKKPLDGKSLKPFLLGQPNSYDADRMIVNYWNNQSSVRSQNFRLSADGALYNLEEDYHQTKNVANAFPSEYQKLLTVKKNWELEVLSELPKEDKRPLIIGHPDLKLTQLPVSEGLGHGNMKRSNQFPNDSHLTNWLTKEDFISWEVALEKEGNFKIDVYYSCSKDNIGTELSVSFGENSVKNVLKKENNVPLIGMEHDAVPRDESYIKDFISLNLGTIHLKPGKGRLTLMSHNLLKANDLDIKLVTLRRIN